ncbi:PREDICTED: uncharacterized protein LOC104588653 [Nelumbo nucifera]|uniref:Uncharacterized protein LOC104588653 n=1 Tax=Nelumbo nucifera TaxID=4432 RepID=A0A1U7YWU8_NELNU|nr:PREDICTED: uncharacterized protein LOC104588653 [Nelumbo nucifera]
MFSAPFSPACTNHHFLVLNLSGRNNKKNTFYCSFSSNNNQYSPSLSLSMDFSGETKTPSVVKLKAIEATPASFEEFGQVIEASPDGDEFGPRDAQLDLSRGIPRFYIMHLNDRPLKFSNITHHASVTQCLGSIGGHAWFLGVAKASVVESGNMNDDAGKKVVQSKCGHYYVPPAPDDVRVFRITGSKFLKLNVGTWHAGPLFKSEEMDFYNLELNNTNVVDHTTHDFIKEDGVVFLVDD